MCDFLLPNELSWQFPTDFVVSALPPNGTILCREIQIVGDWHVFGIGTVIISFLVLCIFACLFKQAWNYGPKVWRSPWIQIFYGYLMMQFAAIFLYGGLMGFAGLDRKTHPLNWVARCFWVPLSWGGYWQVAQFLIASPLVDMGCFSWRGCYRAVNWIISLGLLATYIFFEFYYDDPNKQPAFKKLFIFSRELVYVGNFMVIIEVVYMRWICTKQAFLILISTGINVFALWWTFEFTQEPFTRVNCFYYFMEGITTVLIWYFFILTRPLVELEDDDEHYYSLNDAADVPRKSVADRDEWL